MGDEAPQRLQLLAAGFNAHGQILNSQNGDVRTFTSILADSNAEDIRILFSSWSSTILLADKRLIGLGYQALDQNPCLENDDDSSLKLTSAFGDHNGMLGCLESASGKLYLLEEGRLVCQGDDSPLLAHASVAGNEKVAIAFKQAPNGRLCHILQFDSFAEFLEWYRDPGNVELEAEKQHFMLPGRPRQLLAGTGTFLLLMEGGEVYSWGDARYSSLGRSITDITPERLGLVEALGGLKIEKIACGGWMSAALSEDGALYLWGTGMPGTDRTIRCLREAPAAGDVVLVDLPSSENSGEPLDMADIGVGDNHIAAITKDGGLFVVGDNDNGQVGIGREQALLDDWVQVQGSGAFQRVVCGPKSTFVFLKREHATP